MSDTVKENKHINYQFKLLYAIGMILVVANQCSGGGISLFYEFFPAYSFHVALFIFAAGYFYKDYYETDIAQYFIKKIKSLIIPLYMWNFVYALIAQMMSTRGFSMGIGVTLEQLFVGPIMNGHQYRYNLATWFVAPLFMVEVFNILFRRMLSIFIKNTKVRDCVYIIFALGLGMAGIWMSTKGYNTGGWLVLARLLYFIPFFVGGTFYKKYLQDKDTVPTGIYFLIVIGIQLIIIIYKGGRLAYEQAWCNFTEFSAWPFVVGFLGIAFWLRITKVLEPAIGKSKTVNLIADNTFSIMTNHMFGFMVVKAVYAFFYVHTDTLFQNFNWQEYHNNIWYFYLPKGIEQTRVIYVVCAIAFSIIIQKAIDKVKEKFSKKEIKHLSIGIAIIAVAIAKIIANHVAVTGIEIPVTNNYVLGSTLYFDKSKVNVDKYCVTGFSTHEELLTWTDGKEALMSFVIDGVDSNLVINITCGAYGESQQVDLYVNDNFVDSLLVSGYNSYEVIVPKEYIDGKEMNLKFDLLDASSPAQEGVGQDERLLGISIESMMIDLIK